MPLQLWQKFESATPTDSSGMGNHGTGTYSLVPGKVGGAGLFNGSSDLISVPDVAAFNFGTTMSALCWFRSSTLASQRLVSHWETAGSQRSWNMAVNASGQLMVSLSPDGTWTNGNRIQYAGTVNLCDGKLHLVGFTWSSGVLILYVDGIAISPTKTYDAAFTTLHNSTAALTLGCYLFNTAPSEFLVGLLDDVRLYNEALTAQQVAAVWNGNKGSPRPVPWQARLVQPLIRQLIRGAA